MKVRFKRMRQGAIEPRYQRDGDSGLDLHACACGILNPGETVLIPCGIGIELERGFEAQVRGRSGLSKRGIFAALGTIDSNYRGEIAAVLCNLSSGSFEIKPGDRVAQLVIAPVVTAELVEAEELSETERGANGFGSTGVSVG